MLIQQIAVNVSYTKCTHHIESKRTVVQKTHTFFDFYTFCMHFCSKLTQATLALYKRCTNVYKLYKSQSTLRQHKFYPKSVQKCVLFVYTLVPTTKCTQGKQCLNLNTFCVKHFHTGQHSYYHYLLQIPFVICYIYIYIFLHQFVSVVYFLYTSPLTAVYKKEKR